MMSRIDLHTPFSFNKISFHTYHYTDNRSGSPFYYFAYLEKGSCKIISEAKTIFINKGDIFYIPKNLKYESYWYGEEINFLSLSCASLISFDSKNLSLQVIPCPDELADKLLSIPAVGTRVSARIIADFFNIVAELLPYMSKNTISNATKTLNYAKNYLSTNVHCSNKQLAKACKVSLSYLYQVFKDAENITPNQYRQKCLCRQAVVLLTTTDKSIEEISDILNFSSSSYFRKVFKQNIGSTPREIRKRALF